MLFVTTFFGYVYSLSLETGEYIEYYHSMNSPQDPIFNSYVRSSTLVNEFLAVPFNTNDGYVELWIFDTRTKEKNQIYRIFKYGEVDTNTRSEWYNNAPRCYTTYSLEWEQPSLVFAC